jgi:uncharacterized protein with HEPN domain
VTDPAGLRELDQALHALALIADVRNGGRGAFDSSLDRRLAVAFCLANIGSALKQFCRLRGVGQGTSPFPGAIRMRDTMLYQDVGDLSADILWSTCVEDVGPLLVLIRDLREAL